MDAELSKVVECYYRASVTLDGFSEALSRIATLVGADVCAVVTHNFGDHSGHILHAHGLDPSAAETYAEQFASSDIWFSDPAPFSSAGGFVPGEDVVTADGLRHSRFYREWLKPRNLFFHAFIILERQDDEIVVLELLRTQSHGPFTAEEVSHMENLAFDLHKATVAGTTFRENQIVNRIMRSTLDSLSLGVALLDRNGAVVVANQLARTIIDAGEGIYVANGGLAAEEGGQKHKLKEMIASLTVTHPSEEAETIALSLPRRSGKRPLTMLLTPVLLEDELADGAAAVLYLGDPDFERTFNHERIAKLYGLSRAESRVAALLAAGYRLEQTADILGVAYETVRKHLKQIFSKTGTYRQAELVRILVTGPAGLML